MNSEHLSRHLKTLLPVLLALGLVTISAEALYLKWTSNDMTTEVASLKSSSAQLKRRAEESSAMVATLEQKLSALSAETLSQKAALDAFEKQALAWETARRQLKLPN